MLLVIIKDSIKMYLEWNLENIALHRFKNNYKLIYNEVKYERFKICIETNGLCNLFNFSIR